MTQHSSTESDGETPVRAPQYADVLLPDPEQVRVLIDFARRAHHIVAFTGAGMSTESGIPDYRGPGGVWDQGRPPTIEDFRENPETRRRYWEKRRVDYPGMEAIKPNAGHVALVTLERLGKLDAVITQNIDGLHLQAGSNPDRVFELHGSARFVRCMNCGRTSPGAEIQARLEREPVPDCVVCGGPLRGATVLFGESMPAEPLRQAVAASRACDLMLVIGSSLIVQPAARMPEIAKQAGARIVMINRSPTPLDRLADLVITADAGPTLSALATALEEDFQTG